MSTTRIVGTGRNERVITTHDEDDRKWPRFHDNDYVDTAMTLVASRIVGDNGAETYITPEHLPAIVHPNSTAVDRLMWAHAILGGLDLDLDSLHPLTDRSEVPGAIHAALVAADLYEVPVEALGAGLDDLFDGIGRYIFTSGAWDAMTTTQQWTDHIWAIYNKAQKVLDDIDGLPPLAAPSMFITTDKPLVFQLLGPKDATEWMLMDTLPSPLLCGALRRAASVEHAEDFDHALMSICGFVVTESSVLAVALVGERASMGALTVRVVSLFRDGEWARKSPILCLAIYSLLQRIYYRQGEVVKTRASLRERRAWKKRPVCPRSMPKPFYRVSVSTALSPLPGVAQAADYGWADSEGSGEGPDRGELIFQHSVSAHERLFIRRGKLAKLDSAKRARLVELGYALITEGHLPEYVQEMLQAESRASRGIGPREGDEWIAFKTVRVKRHLRGPDGTPYIPSTRVLE